jgi:hypothetical protein
MDQLMDLLKRGAGGFYENVGRRAPRRPKMGTYFWPDP